MLLAEVSHSVPVAMPTFGALTVRVDISAATTESPEDAGWSQDYEFHRRDLAPVPAQREFNHRRPRGTGRIRFHASGFDMWRKWHGSNVSTPGVNSDVPVST